MPLGWPDTGSLTINVSANTALTLLRSSAMIVDTFSWKGLTVGSNGSTDGIVMQLPYEPPSAPGQGGFIGGVHGGDTLESVQIWIDGVQVPPTASNTLTAATSQPVIIRRTYKLEEAYRVVHEVRTIDGRMDESYYCTPLSNAGLIILMYMGQQNINPRFDFVQYGSKNRATLGTVFQPSLQTQDVNVNKTAADALPVHFVAGFDATNLHGFVFTLDRPAAADPVTQFIVKRASDWKWYWKADGFLANKKNSFSIQQRISVFDATLAQWNSVNNDGVTREPYAPPLITSPGFSPPQAPTIVRNIPVKIVPTAETVTPINSATASDIAIPAGVTNMSVWTGGDPTDFSRWTRAFNGAVTPGTRVSLNSYLGTSPYIAIAFNVAATAEITVTD